MENVNLQLKDPSSIFSDSGQTLKFREVLSFPKTEKVRTALKTGVVRMVLAAASDENLEKSSLLSDTESMSEKESEVKPSKRK